LIARPLVDQVENVLSTCEYILDRDDIYKELRIQGCDYGQEFRRLRRIGTNDFRHVYGINEWTGNVVTYVDALLHSTYLSTSDRTLRQRATLHHARFDPAAMFDAINRHKIAQDDLSDNTETTILTALTTKRADDRYASRVNADVPFAYDAVVQRVVSPGVELEGWTARAVRRESGVDDFVMDSCEFCPNDDHDAIDANVSVIIHRYVEVKLF
jgi:hypothetical protein